MPQASRAPLTCIPDLAIARAIILVVILAFIVILARLGYPPAIALGVVLAGLTAASDPRPALDPGL